MLLRHSHIYMNNECSVVLCLAYVVFFGYGLCKYAFYGRMCTYFL